MRERVCDRREKLGGDGKVYRVVEYEELKPVQTKDGMDFIPGMRRFELENGADVIMLDNRLTIRSTRVTLTEID